MSSAVLARASFVALAVVGAACSSPRNEPSAQRTAAGTPVSDARATPPADGSIAAPLPGDAAASPEAAGPAPGADAPAPLPEANPPVDTTVAPDLPVSPGARRAQLVVFDPAHPTLGDYRLRELLTAQELVVELVDDEAPAAVEGVKLVVLASSSAQIPLAAKYKTVAVPVINLDASIMDDLAMTGSDGDNDFSEQTGDLIEITGPDHPMAAGLRGAVTVIDSVVGMTWGRPGPSAERVATWEGVADKVAIFGYRAGVTMVGFMAPARRVGFFASDMSAGALNANGRKLFAAAVVWALQ